MRDLGRLNTGDRVGARSQMPAVITILHRPDRHEHRRAQHQ